MSKKITDEATTSRIMTPQEMSFWEHGAEYRALSEKAVLTPKEIAEFLKISERVVLTLLRNGLLKGSKVGKVWRIKKEQLDEYLDLEIPRGVINRHSPGMFRDKFYEIIEHIYQDSGWLDSKENREYTRRFSGHMWNCTDILPSTIRDDLGDISSVYLKDYDKGKKIGNCSQVARFLLDVLDTFDPVE